MSQQSQFDVVFVFETGALNALSTTTLGLEGVDGLLGAAEVEELQQVYARVVQTSAQAAPQGQPAANEKGTSQTNGSSDGDVVDGEFTEK